MAKIFVKFNEAVITEVTLTKDETTFGRKPANDIVINHPAVSGHHGKFVKEGDQYFVVDLNSTNGTQINGRKISKSELKHNDHVRIAKHVLEFVDNPAGKVAEPAPSAEEKPKAAPPPPQPKKETPPPAPQRMAPPPPTGGTPTTVPNAVNDIGGTAKPQKVEGAVGRIKIVSGGVNNQGEVQLKDLVTYVGSSDQAIIKIKGFLAPSLAAAISRRPEGYFLKAIKAGYPKVNGSAINEQVLLENGALIECGSTSMMFHSGEKKKENPPKK